MKKTLVLVILDGWGIGREDESNPIHMAKPKSFEWLAENYPVTSLQASGIAVGLPWGEVGNSEVGHLTLGAGKVIYQYYPKITMAVRDGSFFENKALKDAFAHARKNNSAVNLIGLLTRADVHASLDHVKALLQMAEKEDVSRVKLQLFADGKDSPPRTVQNFLKELPREKLASLTGRYYAMDRNQNWRLTQTAYDAIVGEGGQVVEEPEAAIEDNYRRGFTEEYLPPLRFGPGRGLEDNDAVIFFNFREDSVKQIASAFILKDFDSFPIKKFKNLRITTLTHYDDKFATPVAFSADKVSQPLGQILAETRKTQLRLAETYKYAHVTYFFNGYREPPFEGEYRILIPSLSTPRPEEHPEMMASAITDRLVEAVKNNTFDFILVNYANPDTIGHTSDYEAARRAIETIDREMERLLKAADGSEATLLITSDHGNIEEMLNPLTALPESQHDPNPVPLYLMAPGFKGRRFANYASLAVETTGSLADVAPTILEMMKIDQPAEMTGRSLLEELM